jgi:ATPase subunit of ABC transporter with duplicated ATPase domains
MRASLSINHATFAWPDGSIVVDGLDLSLGPGRHGLVGPNGCGKSTLLRLAAGELAPQDGTVAVDGAVGYLPQDPGVDPTRTVADVLGVSATLEALARLESGDVRQDDLDLVDDADGWDVEERTAAELSSLGLGHITLDRTIASVSGGELVLLSLTSLLLRRPAVLLLDEPTNNLDRAARARLVDVVSGWRGTLLVVSHDRELLNAMNDIGELRDGRLTWYGGTYDDYEAAVAVEQEAAQRAVRAAESDLRAQKRDLVESQTRLAHRRKAGEKAYAEKRQPKIAMGNAKRRAQVSAGRLTGLHQSRLETATDQLDAAEARVRDDREVRIDLPDTAVPTGRVVLVADGLAVHGRAVLDLDVRGPERIGLTGPNGSGKTSLLRAIAGELEARTGTVEVSVPMRYLPQRMDVLDDALTVADNIARIAPEATETQRRSRLARFLFRGRDADQLAASLSGGERLRATLACLLLAQPAPQLLLLDEPTNNLDLSSIGHLVDALRSYEGALIVVSHDERFLDDLELTRRVEV